MKSILSVVFLLVIAGCAGMPTISQLRAEASSGRVGCPANEIAISNNERLTWTASCRDKVFYCSTGDGTDCREGLRQ